MISVDIILFMTLEQGEVVPHLLAQKILKNTKLYKQSKGYTKINECDERKY